MQGLGFVLMCFGGPYPLFVFAYYLNGFGLGLQDAQVNALTSRLPNAATKMFLMHAVYGLGATISPLVSTEFVKAVPAKFYTYFAVSVGLALATFLCLVGVFRGRTEDQVVGVRIADPVEEGGVELGNQVVEVKPDDVGVVGVLDIRESKVGGRDIEATITNGGSGGKMKRIMRTPAVHFMAFYILVYVRLSPYGI